MMTMLASVVRTSTPLARSVVGLSRKQLREQSTASFQTLHRHLKHSHIQSGNVAQRRKLSTSSKLLHASPVESIPRQQQQQQADVSSGTTTSSSSSPQENPIVIVDAKECKVGVTWSSGIESKYHNIWLRDHCRCTECYHPQTKQRQFDTFSIPLDVQPHSVEATTEGLLIHWPKLNSQTTRSAQVSTSEISEQISATESSPNITSDVTTTESDENSLHNLHASLYPWSWLYSNSYSPSLSLGGSHSSQTSSNVILWGNGLAQQPPTVTFEEVMNVDSDRGLARWLNKIGQFGFCFVSGVPHSPEETERLIRRIAFIRETHYGGFWDFTSDLSHGDTAYTNLALGAHTDTTYFTDPAGLQLFHLLSHTEATKDGTPARGGESLLVDGFFAAKILREVYPEAYRVLSTTRVSTHSAGDDGTLIRPLQSGGYPILEHDRKTGELIRVRYNNDDRSVLRVREEEVIPFYSALSKWYEILTHKDSEFWSQLQPGQALIFDNNRVLHGRSAFTGNRRLCGAYVNHDDFRSRLFVLQKQFPDIDGAAFRRTSSTSSSNNQSGQGTVGSSDTESVSGRRGVWDDGL